MAEGTGYETTQPTERRSFCAPGLPSRFEHAGLISPWVIGIATDTSDSGRQIVSGLTVNGWENDCIRQLMTIPGVQVWLGLQHIFEMRQRMC